MISFCICIDIEAAKSHYTNYRKSEGIFINLFNSESYLNNYHYLKNIFANDKDSATKHYVEFSINKW